MIEVLNCPNKITWEMFYIVEKPEWFQYSVTKDCVLQTWNYNLHRTTIMVTTPRENIKNSKQKHSNRTLSCGETPSTDKKLGIYIEYHGFCPSTSIIMGNGEGGGA